MTGDNLVFCELFDLTASGHIIKRLIFLELSHKNHVVKCRAQVELR